MDKQTDKQTNNCAYCGENEAIKNRYFHFKCLTKARMMVCSKCAIELDKGNYDLKKVNDWARKNVSDYEILGEIAGKG